MTLQKPGSHHQGLLQHNNKQMVSLDSGHRSLMYRPYTMIVIHVMALAMLVIVNYGSTSNLDGLQCYDYTWRVDGVGHIVSES